MGGLLPAGDTWEMILHYRSDERLDEMISSVSEVLQWMDKAKKARKNVCIGGTAPHWTNKLQRRDLNLVTGGLLSDIN